MCAVDTVDEVASLPRVDASNASNVGTCYWTALRALHLVSLATRTIRTLCSILAESHQGLMQQELDEPNDLNADDVGGGTRKQFLHKSLALWKQKRSVGFPSLPGADAEAWASLSIGSRCSS
eukprot:3498794-Amphidinium_carterae.2